MAEKNVQEQIDELNHKLDRVLEFVEIQHRKREEWDDLMECARDLALDLTPILRQIGLDVIQKMNELDEKGYIASFTTIAKNLTSKETVDALVRISQALADVKMDDRLDDQSFWQLFKQIRSREVRKSLSYSLRLVEEINKK
ncbi:MAG: hypothetical protein ABIJ04_00105 [Bacteroidota bacterium]